MKKTNIIDSNEYDTSKTDGTHQEPTNSKSDTKEPFTSDNTQNTSSLDAEKTEYISPNSSIADNKEQITNIPSINNNTEQPTNSQIGENTAKTTSDATNVNINKTTKPSNIEKTSIFDNTEKVVSTSSLPEQITNKPSIDKEPEPNTNPSDQEEIKQSTSSPNEETPTPNKNNNDVVMTIPTSLNLTFFSKNLVENPKTTIIENVAQKTEEINIQ